jgi:hypothetical protein
MAPLQFTAYVSYYKSSVMMCYLIQLLWFHCVYEFRTVNDRSSSLLTVVVCMYACLGCSSTQKPNVYCCSCKHRFVYHTAVATADHIGAVLTIIIRVYLETVLLNKQEVKHEYVYT